MIAAPKHVPLAVATRGVGAAQSIESVHSGSVAVVDTQGRLVRSIGDPHALTFSRSTLKPFQALPFVAAQGPQALRWTSREIALSCASHSGEPMHAELASSMLTSIGCTEPQLQCGCHTPYAVSEGVVKSRKTKWDQTYNNCSGKHSGFLAWCRVHDAPLETYLEEGHPLQRAIRSTVARYSGVDETQLVVGIDGCSAPNYALPLAPLARLFAQLARPADAVAVPDALDTLARAMTAHPELVSGTRRSDLAYMTAFGAPDASADLVSKVGAAGVQLFGIRSAGLGVAIKIADGSPSALHCVAVAVLDQLDLLDDARRARLADYARPSIKNHRGTVTGEIRPVFSLLRA